MGGNNSLLKPLFGDNSITTNIASNNTNCNILIVYNDWKWKERQSESDKESRSCWIEEDKNNWPIQGKEGLALQPTKFYVEEIGISP